MNTQGNVHVNFALSGTVVLRRRRWQRRGWGKRGGGGKKVKRVAHIITHHVQTDQSDNYFPRGLRTGLFIVDHRDDELENAAEYQAAEEQDATATVADDDGRVDQDGHETHGAQDATHAERVGHVGHGEEVGFVRCFNTCRRGVWVSIATIKRWLRNGTSKYRSIEIPTDDKHAS